MTLYLLGGFVLLFAAGELLVRGASNLAEKLGVQPLVIGIVVVGFGTSVPELVTSVQAALRGSPGISIGNIVGSNVANMLLILGAGAVIYPIVISRGHLFRDGGIGAIGALFLGLAAWWRGGLDFISGLILITGLVIYLWFLLHDDHKKRKIAVADGGFKPQKFFTMAVFIDLLTTVAGITGVLLGGKWLVDGAVWLAHMWGISESVIGLTVVALGTSLPELATSVVAALKRHSDLAVGNVLGSNIYNIYGIGGVTAVITPVGISGHMARVDIPLLIVLSVVLIAIIFWQRGITRLTGAAFLVGYLAYVFALFN
ncbi:MAG TPA: calcium/sodium antiporter [Rhizobiales bacterium]|nr:calcium/sodium antiporter [Hyphomicrobiales bacterium]